ncbi:histone-lysine N-methyltransferase-2 [Elsinoe australis]|uniref:Histone-lysine N-methyltransferase, H3 lysine-4 specific n=1 Tax=Elsinoe australis TaxID=40998 RepID=A0A4U7AQA1_9PEZI|nr:histone-lysine N-methyltransferase-2 [Elsinoe australis]
MTSSAFTNGRSPLSRRPDSKVEDAGDLLNGVGSSSSLNSTASSVFSTNTQAHKLNGRTSAWSSTPLTSSEPSPPKAPSPMPAATTSRSHMNGASNHHLAPDTSRIHSGSVTPLASPPRDRKQARPPPGEVKGYRAVWDPELDNKLGKETTRKMKPKVKTFGTEVHEPDAPPDPRLAIVGYTSGKCVPPNAASKSRLRIAPYALRPYAFDSKTSIGPGPPKQIVVTGFDPFTSEAQLKTFFSSYGEVAEIQNQTDPNTASYLGICLIRYRDSSRPSRGNATQAAATAAAKKAEKEATGERIGLKTIKVECDREGRKCKRYVERVLRKAHAEQEAERAKSKPAPVPSKEPSQAPASTPHPADSPAPPPNAPKGPSGSAKPGVKPPEGPKAATQKTGANALIEEEPVLSKIKRKPYILIPASSVPVLGTTIPHLKKRLKAFDWKEIRLDQTGYYAVFDDSKRGEDETVRCFNECNNQLLFTYTMNMECQQYGNPEYERSPSPERVMAEKRQKEEIERLQKWEDEDVEVEKKHRAEDLDPVKGALDLLAQELRSKIMDDIKIRVAIPALYECLDPALHATKRRKLGLSDAMDNENKVPSVLLNKALDTSPGSPRARRPLSHSKPLRPHDPNSQRRGLNSTNAYADERRRNRPAPKAAPARPLHFRLQDMFRDDDDDSDDERRTSVTRDTEDLESRPMSRTSRTSTPFESDLNETPRNRKRKAEHVIWDTEDEQETFMPHYKQLLGDILQKRPEDMAVGELQQVINTLSSHKPDSALLKRARTELQYRKRMKFDDDLFKTGDTPTGQSTPVHDGQVNGSVIDADAMLVDDKEVLVKKEKAKKKRKTKKELLLERQELEKQAEEAAKAAVEDDTEVEQLHEKVRRITYEEEIEEDYIDPELGAKVEWGVSTDEPRRTVEDEDNLVLDIDGWQHLVKDPEDFELLRKAALQESSARINDIQLWTWKQKEIKSLNNGNIVGPVNSEPHIPGYYVPTATGSARTEGIKKILNSEKSKYLPHRIKVQKAREEREALAKNDPAGAVEAAKQAAAAKVSSTATSRSARVNNRRMVNDINLQKQNAPASGMEADAFRFNQLKKRKKLVKFDRSAIHGWGLYSEENIPAGDLIIEYVGEKVRQKVADNREEMYDRQGVGSSYLFRMVDDEIIDATKKGGIARFINHSCTPNCTAKIIKVEGTRRIVIYALKDIEKNDELTYDYKFERELGSTDRIPCLCGSVGCKGFLN